LATSLPNLPGGAWDLYVPSRGELLAVVGVAFDDILEVHSGPGENTPLVDTFAPLEEEILSAGEGRSLSALLRLLATLARSSSTSLVTPTTLSRENGSISLDSLSIVARAFR
jgi:hypothetical protein